MFCHFRNLNPYEVLQVDPDLDFSEVKKKYRRMSILVHPDKNQDDVDRAQAAFDALKKAFALLEVRQLYCIANTSTDIFVSRLPLKG